MKRSPAMSAILCLLISLAAAASPASAAAAMPAASAVASVSALSLTASPTASVVLVDGRNVAFDAYNISGSNYFKLRDLAFALTGTASQFEVGWDGQNNAITLISGSRYTPVGGEMAGKGAQAKTAAASSAKIYIDGREAQLAAYLIEGNNYFKLRDIGAALGFGVDWDEGLNTVIIDTSKAYSAADASDGSAGDDGAGVDPAADDATKGQAPAAQNSPWIKTTYTPADIDTLKTRSIIFAHNSVGQNIIDGLKALEPGFPVASGSMGGANGITANTIGYNGDPTGKLKAFVTLMDNGGHRAQIAMFKLCYADFQAYTNVEQLFTDYTATMDALAAKYPGVIFTHVTAPLYHYNASWNNSVQHAFNEKLRAQYGGLVFDLAEIESVDASGKPVLSRDGATPALAEEWTSDGSHLNNTGSKRLASALISFLAQL